MWTYRDLIRIVFAHLQEALRSSRWMFWTLRMKWNETNPNSTIQKCWHLNTYIFCILSKSKNRKDQFLKNWVVDIHFSPFPPSHVAAAEQCHCCGPTWPGLSWWTGQWYTGLCCESLQTGPPKGSERPDWPWRSQAQNLKSHSSLYRATQQLAIADGAVRAASTLPRTPYSDKELLQTV